MNYDYTDETTRNFLAKLYKTASGFPTPLERHLQRQLDDATHWLMYGTWQRVERYVLITQDGMQVQGDDAVGNFVLIGTTGNMSGAICRSETDALLRCNEWNEAYPDTPLHVEHYRNALRRAVLSWKMLVDDLTRTRIRMEYATYVAPESKGARLD